MSKKIAEIKFFYRSIPLLANYNKFPHQFPKNFKNLLLEFYEVEEFNDINSLVYS